jgi:hypothetical protein
VLYDFPEVPEGRDEVVTARVLGALATTSSKLADFVWVGLLLSLTVAVRLAVPLAVGEPEIAPEIDKVNPAGRLPEVIDQV